MLGPKLIVPTLASRATDVATSNPACVWVLPLHASDDSTCMLQTHSGIVKTFFVHYAMGLLHVGLSNPVDIFVLTAVVLEGIDWARGQPGCGSAWQHAVQAALQGMSLETRFAVLKQPLPQSLASAGVHEVGESAQSACLWT